LLKWPDLVSGLGLNPLQPFPRLLSRDLLTDPRLAWSTAGNFHALLEKGPLAYFLASPFELSVSSESLLPQFALAPAIPLIVTLYDLIPLIYEEDYLKDAATARLYKTRLDLIRQADLVLAISECTRTDALQLLGLDPSRVATIGSGVSGYFRSVADNEDPLLEIRSRLPQIKKQFILSVAGADKRKNVEGLIQAYACLAPDLKDSLQLVVVCQLSAEFRDRWRAQAKLCGLKDADLVLTDMVPDATLRALYQSAQLFVFPSIYEGFGLPVVEAAACGCPAITSNTSSVKEILDFEPATFDPLDAGAMSALIERALLDDPFRERLIKVGNECVDSHTWENVAQKTVDSLQRLGDPAPPFQPMASSRRLRLALVGPFPPARSGIADYNLRVACELAELCSLDVLVSADFDRAAVGEIGSARRFPLEALGRTLNPFAYDAIIYTFGNSGHHHLTYEMASRYPGLIWFHDVRLSGFYLSYGITRFGPAGLKTFIAEKLDCFYHGRVATGMIADPSVDMDDYNKLNLGMTFGLAQSSRGVIVNSRYAQRVLQMDQGPLAALPPIKVFPLAVPKAMEGFSGRREGRPGEGGLDIGSFGIGARHKAPEALIEALALVRRRLPAELVFVGPADDNFLAMVKLLANRAGVAESVHLTGDLNQYEYWGWLGRVTCAVQLRKLSHGESSAAISDCLAAGTPVLTNIPSAADLPAGTVDLVAAEAAPGLLADRLQVLLTNPAVREAHAQAGRRYAATRTHRTVAEEIIEFVMATEALSGPRQDPLRAEPVGEVRSFG